MSYKVLLCCDIIGCRTMGDATLAKEYPTITIPNDWRRLVEPAADPECPRYGLMQEGYIICPDHAKLFPRIPERVTK
jgi:hypothetical protein